MQVLVNDASPVNDASLVNDAILVKDARVVKDAILIQGSRWSAVVLRGAMPKETLWEYLGVVFDKLLITAVMHGCWDQESVGDVR